MSQTLSLSLSLTPFLSFFLSLLLSFFLYPFPSLHNLYSFLSVSTTLTSFDFCFLLLSLTHPIALPSTCRTLSQGVDLTAACGLVEHHERVWDAIDASANDAVSKVNVRAINSFTPSFTLIVCMM